MNSPTDPGRRRAIIRRYPRLAQRERHWGNVPPRRNDDALAKVPAMHPHQQQRRCDAKRGRLPGGSTVHKNGTVKFSRKGSEELLNQLLDPSLEKLDQLVVTLAWLILGVAEERAEQNVASYI